MNPAQHPACNSEARKREAESTPDPQGLQQVGATGSTATSPKVAPKGSRDDREALAEVLISSWALQGMLTPPFDGDRDDARADAEAILASSWLAQHDAQVRRETWDLALRWVRAQADVTSPEYVLARIDRAEPFNPYRQSVEGGA